VTAKFQFDQLLREGKIKQAAHLALKSPQILRTEETLSKLGSIPTQLGNSSALIQYFSALLETKTVLNESETLTLVRATLANSKTNLVEIWLKEEILTCTESLGDLAKPYSPIIALSSYVRAKCHAKVVLMFLQSGDFEKAAAYTKRTEFVPNYIQLFKIALSEPNASENCATFVLFLVRHTSFLMRESSSI